MKDDRDNFLQEVWGSAVKTKRNYPLVAVIYATLLGTLVVISWRISEPMRSVLATILVIALVGLVICTPLLIKKMPPSEEYKTELLRLGYMEMDGKVVKLEQPQLTGASGSHRIALPPETTGQGGETDK